ncbi:hypothetical protein Tco_1121538 [Tanacetum coccineum]|uniref:Uncharacterized protein n=1 Tax=Tanacetum coccineum TaxID=301880 RepID=A0ABQ5IXZ5_9ASTR
MLNKENYVPRSSRLLWYAKSRPNGKLIYNSIMNGPYVRRMIPEPGDAYREVLVNKTFHEQTDIAQPGMNMGQDRQIQMVGGNGGNQFRQYAGQNVGNQNGNGNVVAAQVEGNAIGNNEDIDVIEGSQWQTAF